VKRLNVRLPPELRQRRQHRAFRIAAPHWPDAQLVRFEHLLTSVDVIPEPDPPAEPEPDPPAKAEPDRLDQKALISAATNLWQARRKVIQLAEDANALAGQAKDIEALAQEAEDVKARVRQAERYLRRCDEALADAGLVVRDHDGEAFNAGRSLEALVFHPDASLTVETVLETVRPSIFLRDHRIQMGQVIVGRPANSAQFTEKDPITEQEEPCATRSTLA
jgi:hypothetical protein